MLITPEQQNASNTRERVMTFQDTSHPREDLDNEDKSHCCISGSQTSGTGEVENSCVTSGLSCLRLSGQNCSSSPPQQEKKWNPKLGHLNTVITPKKRSPRLIKTALFLTKDDDNEAFQSLSNTTTPTSSSPTSCPPLSMTPDGEKQEQEVIAGRLYLIRQIGNPTQSTASPSSPSRSFTKAFNFSTIGLSSPTSSPPSHQSPNAKRKLPVYVRVYRCHKDHFALISRDSSYSSGHIYLNMRHCRVMPGNPIGRFIVAGNSDSGSLMEFETPDLDSLGNWLDALQTLPESPSRMNSNCGGGSGNVKNGNNSLGSPSIPKSPGLPTLTEAEEEDR